MEVFIENVVQINYFICPIRKDWLTHSIDGDTVA